MITLMPTIYIKGRLSLSFEHTNRHTQTDRLLYSAIAVVDNIGVRAIFWRGAGSILPEKYGAAPEKWTPELTWLNRTRQESLISIVENRWRTYIYIYIVLLSSVFVKHALNSHFVKYILPDQLLDCPKKYFARLWGLQPPSSYAYGW